ncbi:Inositol 1-3-4-trisphosphate 5/6-kinase ATP-grasp domain [Arabidopsis suecica]|uniref:inositol-1,3,4-trisphosphate 5/6-kinase n=1 Tax=Arabidopsis suecica TaxID=45249 RepID=A0A8T2BJ02_ARASU|nr:Inositol 1-3-4-trisphosphate 5/6-kinase ATP-grasp domain [Arabidopsis suecica]
MSFCISCWEMNGMMLLRFDKLSAFTDYQQKHPEVTVLDPPCAIQRIYNRQSMLQGIADINLADCDGMICVPKQMVVLKNTTSSTNEVAEAGLNFPLVAKPLLVDGTAKSHQLFLAYDRLSLAELEPPLVLQEFVNHGGVLFKVFVVGDVIKVVRRFSLPNVSNCEKEKVAGVFQFPRVSSSAASVDKTDLDPRVAELPPKPLLEGLVRELRNRLGLRLFNIDMIREHGSRDVFYVIDINYFPGYGKMPDYEQVFIDFFLSLAQAKHNKIQCVS